LSCDSTATKRPESADISLLSTRRSPALRPLLKHRVYPAETSLPVRLSKPAMLAATLRASI
jgi:hypothetical protein